MFVVCSIYFAGRELRAVELVAVWFAREFKAHLVSLRGGGGASWTTRETPLFDI